jgi:hypothetical protein
MNRKEAVMIRRVMAWAVVPLLLLAGGLGNAGAGERWGHGRIEGTWLVKVLFEEGTELETRLQYLQTFNEDGRTTFLLPTGGPDDYAETGDTRVGCMGEWKHRARARGPVFDITMLCLPTQQWVPTGENPTSYQEIQAKAFLLKGGKTWKGPFTISNYLADGTQFFSGNGEMVATRVELHPLP